MQSKLKIDMDWKPPKEWLDIYLNITIQALGSYYSSLEVKESHGGKGYHIIIHLTEEISDMRACRWQFILGDDRTRCRLNYARIKAEIKGWNKLWSYKIKRSKT